MSSSNGNNTLGTGATTYPATEIQVLDTMSAIRKRPGMYVGDIKDPLRANTLLQETLCMAISDGVHGKVKNVTVELFADGRASVTDDGEGWPIEPIPQGSRGGPEISRAQAYMTLLYACKAAKESEGGNARTAGLCNMGIVTVNALSVACSLTIWRGGYVYEQNYVCGTPTGPLEKTGTTSISGTRVSFTLDPEILPQREFLIEQFLDWCTEMGTIQYTITDHRTNGKTPPCTYKLNRPR